ncbi:MAG: SDR family oxidoreductase, partial [Candidatus Eremiobacteraeota bacterium]|nr:SDR family oxidoreductase [Candidatus Eremiobacteraeota bacterium]
MPPRKTALVTGASSGIGLELATLFAKDGHDVVLVARSGSQLNALAERLHSTYGIVARALVKDLSNPAAPREIFAEVPSVDFLVNNAGYGWHGAFAQANPDEQLAMLRVNVTALMELTGLYLPGMVSRGSGRVLNVGSTAGFLPGPFMAVYYASKAFVISFTEAIAEELRGTGVTATCLAPGATGTGFVQRSGVGSTRLFKSALA